MNKKTSWAKIVTRFASAYNASALVLFLVPGGLTLLGMEEPNSPFWRVLPALLATFAAIVLWLSSKDLEQYASFPVWNGIIRIVFAVIVLASDYPSTVGSFILLLAIGDLAIGFLCILLVKRNTSKSFIQLLLNN